MEERKIMFTIKDFLEIDYIPWYKNLTDMEIPFTKPIEDISSNELPINGFIKKGELVITNAAPLMANTEDLSLFITDMAKQNGAVLVLSCPDDEISLPDKHKQLARSCLLPIIQIPWTVRFADLCKTVTEEIHKESLTYINIFKEIQEELLKAFLANKSLADAKNIISKNLRCNTTITDINGNVLAGNERRNDMSELTLDSDNHKYGHLYINAKLSAENRSTLRMTLSPLLSLWFYRNEIISLTEQNIRDDFIWNLANGIDISSPDILRSAKLMGLKLDKAYTCIIMRVKCSTYKNDDWIAEWCDKNYIAVNKQVCNFARGEIMVTHVGNIFLIYLENLTSNQKQDISLFCDKIESFLTGSLEKIVVTWGISEIHEGYTDYATLYSHAKMAEEICSNNNNNNQSQRYFYETTILFVIMSTLSENKYCTETANNIIMPLITHDKEKHTKLVETLRVYLNCKNISETARKLGKHRQTLIYQLKKIEELTGLSLDNNDELFLLEICMRLKYTLI